VAKRGKFSVQKRRREAARRLKKQDKEERRARRKEEVEDNVLGDDEYVDPDIAHITPGPQPALFDVPPLEEDDDEN